MRRKEKKYDSRSGLFEPQVFSCQNFLVLVTQMRVRVTNFKLPIMGLYVTDGKKIIDATHTLLLSQLSGMFFIVLPLSFFTLGLFSLPFSLSLLFPSLLLPEPPEGNCQSSKTNKVWQHFVLTCYAQQTTKHRRKKLRCHH